MPKPKDNKLIEQQPGLSVDKVHKNIGTSAPQSIAKQSSIKLKYIDALRGFAIIGVIIRHTGDNGTNHYLPDILRSAILNGSSGVSLFYFISAYTLMLSLHSRVKLESNFIKNFYLRRFFRIAPMFYVAIVYYIWQNAHATMFVDGIFSSFSGANIFSHIFLVHGLSPEWINSVVPGGWSVADEVMFYLILPILFYKITTLQKATIVFLVTLILRFVLDFFLRKYYTPHDAVLSTGFLSFYLPGQLPVFALGIVFYFLVENKFNFRITPAVILSFGIILIIHLSGVVILPSYVLFCIAFFIITTALSKREFKLLVNPFISFIGKISYSMYLSHFAVIYWLANFNVIDTIHATNATTAIINYCIRFLLVFIITVPVSWFFYTVIELPMQRFGYRFLKTRAS